MSYEIGDYPDVHRHRVSWFRFQVSKLNNLYNHIFLWISNPWRPTGAFLFKSLNHSFSLIINLKILTKIRTLFERITRGKLCLHTSRIAFLSCCTMILVTSLLSMSKLRQSYNKKIFFALLPSFRKTFHYTFGNCRHRHCNGEILHTLLCWNTHNLEMNKIIPHFLPRLLCL